MPSHSLLRRILWSASFQAAKQCEAALCHYNYNLQNSGVTLTGMDPYYRRPCAYVRVYRRSEKLWLQALKGALYHKTDCANWGWVIRKGSCPWIDRDEELDPSMCSRLS